jgi:hypothetical protein
MQIEHGPLPTTVLHNPDSWTAGEYGPLIALVPSPGPPRTAQ